MGLFCPRVRLVREVGRFRELFACRRVRLLVCWGGNLRRAHARRKFFMEIGVSLTRYGTRREIVFGLSEIVFFEPEKAAGGRIPKEHRTFIQESVIFEPEKKRRRLHTKGAQDFYLRRCYS